MPDSEEEELRKKAALPGPDELTLYDKLVQKIHGYYSKLADIFFEKPAPAQQKNALEEPGKNASQEHDDPMQGVRPSGRWRDYSALQEIHERAKQQQLDAHSASAMPAQSQHQENAIQPPEALQGLIGHIAQRRRIEDLRYTQAELIDRGTLTNTQMSDRRTLDHVHRDRPGREHREARTMLEHRCLAERADFEATLLADHLRRQGSPDAEIYMRHAQRASGSAQAIEAIRKDPGAIRAWLQEVDQGQQAARDGRSFEAAARREVQERTDKWQQPERPSAGIVRPGRGRDRSEGGHGR